MGVSVLQVFLRAAEASDSAKAKPPPTTSNGIAEEPVESPASQSFSAAAEEQPQFRSLSADEEPPPQFRSLSADEEQPPPQTGIKRKAQDPLAGGG